MLGFVPNQSTKENYNHGTKLMDKCQDPAVVKICDWWQTPECYYAYESVNGATWWGQHDGPSRYCQSLIPIVAAQCRAQGRDLPKYRPATLRTTSLNCFCCLDPLAKTMEDMCQVAIMSCSCSNWYMHNKCFKQFILPRCFKCHSLYSSTVVHTKLATLLGSPK